MPQSPLDPEQTTDVDELLESSGCINPNVGVTIAPMSDNRHRRNASNMSKFTLCNFYVFGHRKKDKDLLFKNAQL